MRRGETIAGALKKLGLQIDPDETLIVIKGQNVGLEFQPNEGDIIHLIPAIAGG
jgi:sulfur carrier protein ThiS